MSLPMPMPNLTLPPGFSVPLPSVSLPYMPSAAGTLPVSLTVAPTMPPVNLSAVGMSGMMPLTAAQLDATAAAGAATQRMPFFRLLAK